MKKNEILNIANQNNGYIYSDIIKKYNIPTISITRMVNDGILKRVDRGIYISDLGVVDDLFIYSIKYSRIVYSGETSLFLNGLSNKQCPIYEFTIPYGTNAPKIDGFNIKYDRTDNFNLGISKIKTPFGSIVRAYDKERCICDLFLRSDYYDYEDRVYAINVYTKHYLNYKKLYSYAKKLNVYEEVKNVFEVIGWN